MFTSYFYCNVSQALQQQLSDLQAQIDRTSIPVPGHSLFEIIGVPSIEQSHRSDVTSPAETLRAEERTGIAECVFVCMCMLM